MSAVQEAVASLHGIVGAKKKPSHILRMCTKHFNFMVGKLLGNENLYKQKSDNYEGQTAVNFYCYTDSNYSGLGENRRGIYFCFERFMIEQCGSGSSVGIATDYGLDGPGSNPGGDEIFHQSRPGLGPTQPPAKWVPCLSRG